MAVAGRAVGRAAAQRVVDARRRGAARRAGRALAQGHRRPRAADPDPRPHGRHVDARRPGHVAAGGADARSADRRRPRARCRRDRNGPAAARAYRTPEPRVAPPAARPRRSAGGRPGDLGGAHGAQHHQRPARHLPFLRAAGAVPRRGAIPAYPAGRVRPVPAAQRRDPRRGAPLRPHLPAHAAGPRPAARAGPGARG